jgi:hypothetical protein
MLALAAAALVLLATGPADAQSPDAEASSPVVEPLSPQELDPTRAFVERIILIVRTPGDDGVMTRLYAELRQSDWRIVEIRADLDAPPLGTSAVREGATAAVRVDARRGIIVLWVQRPEGAFEETIGTSGEPWDEQILALRGAEVLRARGLLVEPQALRDDGASARPPERTPPAPVVDAPADSREAPRRSDDPPRLWLALGAGLAVSPGGLGPLPLADAGVGVSFDGRWSLGARGLMPLTSQTVSAPEGEADVATWLALGVVEVDWARFGWGGLRSGIGGGAAITTMSGQAEESGFDGTSDTVVTFAPLVSSSFHADMGRSFRVRAAIALGATLPEVRVSFGSREVASFGRPFLLAGVVIESSPLGW